MRKNPLPLIALGIVAGLSLARALTSNDQPSPLRQEPYGIAWVTPSQTSGEQTLEVYKKDRWSKPTSEFPDEVVQCDIATGLAAMVTFDNPERVMGFVGETGKIVKSAGGTVTRLYRGSDFKANRARFLEADYLCQNL